MKALVAVEHAMITAAWHMLTNGEFYHDPGADYYTRHDPAKAKARAVKQLEALGYRVTVQPWSKPGNQPRSQSRQPIWTAVKLNPVTNQPARSPAVVTLIFV